jgi:hypothetical protein
LTHRLTIKPEDEEQPELRHSEDGDDGLYNEKRPMNALTKYTLVVLFSFVCDPVYAADIPALVRKTRTAVLELSCYDQAGQWMSGGTAFFISSDGKALTNNHVIEGASRVVAKALDGKLYSKVRLLIAPEANYRHGEDIAELQFLDAKDVSYLSLGSSKDLMEGQRVLVIGSPEGLNGTVSDGLVSAFREKGTIVQITVPVSHGSSGSPVLDESGNVLGMVVGINEAGQNLNFAISLNAIKAVMLKSVPHMAPSDTKTLNHIYEEMFSRDAPAPTIQSLSPIAVATETSSGGMPSVTELVWVFVLLLALIVRLLFASIKNSESL